VNLRRHVIGEYPSFQLQRATGAASDEHRNVQPACDAVNPSEDWFRQLRAEHAQPWVYCGDVLQHFGSHLSARGSILNDNVQLYAVGDRRRLIYDHDGYPPGTIGLLCHQTRVEANVQVGRLRSVEQSLDQIERRGLEVITGGVVKAVVDGGLHRIGHGERYAHEKHTAGVGWMFFEDASDNP
jgi:hypothetical protein